MANAVFTRLVDDHYAWLYRFALSLSRSLADASAARSEYLTPEHEPLVLGGSGRLRELLTDLLAPSRPTWTSILINCAPWAAAASISPASRSSRFVLCSARPTSFTSTSPAAAPSAPLAKTARSSRPTPRLRAADRGRPSQTPHRALNWSKKTGNKIRCVRISLTP